MTTPERDLFEGPVSVCCVEMYLFLGKHYINYRCMRLPSNTCWLIELGYQEYLEHEKWACHFLYHSRPMFIV